MTASRQITCNELVHSGFFVTFSDAEALFVSVTGDEKVSIPEELVQRCGLLVDIRDQDASDEEHVPVPLSIRDAKSWLTCATMDKAAELRLQDDATLLGALKVSRPTSKIGPSPEAILFRISGDILRHPHADYDCSLNASVLPPFSRIMWEPGHGRSAQESWN